MTEQLDRIEAAIVALTSEVSSLRQGQESLQQGQDTLRQELKQDIADLKGDIARMDGRIDRIDRQLDGEVTQITSMVLNLGDQVQRSENAMEDFKREIRTFVVDMQHLRGIFQAHTEHTDRILNYLMRRLGPDSAA